MKRSLLFQILAVHIFIYRALSKDVTYEYELHRIEQIFGDEKTLFKSELKIIRVNKEYYINGTATITEDLDDNYLFISEAWHSPMMNSNFMKTPYRLPTSTFCVFVNTTYKMLIQSEMFEHSNIPFIPAEGLCPFPKDTYYVKEFKLSYDILPQHVASGMWYFQATLMTRNKYVGGFRVFVKITQKQ